MKRRSRGNLGCVGPSAVFCFGSRRVQIKTAEEVEWSLDNCENNLSYSCQRQCKHSSNITTDQHGTQCQTDDCTARYAENTCFCADKVGMSWPKLEDKLNDPLIIAKTIFHLDASVVTTTMRPTLPTSMALNVTTTTAQQGMFKLPTFVCASPRLTRDPSHALLSMVFECKRWCRDLKMNGVVRCSQVVSSGQDSLFE